MRNGISKKLVFLIFTGLLVVSFASSALAQKVTLTFATREGGLSLEVQKWTIEEFNKRNPNIKIKLLPIPYAAYEDKITTQIVAGRGPDLVTNNQNYIGHWIGMDALLDLTDYMPSGYEDHFKEASWNIISGGTKGEAYGVPIWDLYMLILYNKDILDKVGVEPPLARSEAWTWDDYMAVARKTKAIGTRDSTAFWAFSNPTKIQPVYANGGSVLTEDGKAPAINSPASLEALKWMEQIFREGLAPEYNFSSWDTVKSDFYGGDMAMFWGWNNMSLDGIEEGIGDKFEWGLMLHPVQKQGATFLGVNIYSVFVTSKHHQEAWEFCSFAASKEIMEKGCSETSTIPSRIDMEMVKWERNAHLAPVVSAEGEVASIQAITEGRSPAWSEIDQSLRKEMELMALGQKTAEEVARDTAEMIRKALEKYEVR